MRKIATFLIVASVWLGISRAEAQECGTELLPEATQLTSLDEQAISILEAAVMREAEAKEEVARWSNDLRTRQLNNQTLTVLEHVALAYISRSGFFNSYWDPSVAKTIQESLKHSWYHLTGSETGDIDGRLPKTVLRTASREARLFHASSFQPDIVSGSRSARDAFSKAEDVRLASDYIPEAKDLTMAMAMLGASFEATGSEILASSLLGYAAATLAEYAMHKHLGHPTKKLRQIFAKAGWMGRYALATAIGHSTIHHGRTYRKAYTEQFSSEEEQRLLDEELEALGDDGKEIIKSRYGVTLSHSGVRAGLFAGLLASAPVYAALTTLFGVDPIVGLSAFAPSLLFVFASKYLHPYLHMNRDEALAKAGPFGRWFLKTRYAEMMSRLHYVHHAGVGREGNYNLVFGADAVLGELHKPTLREVLAMRRLGLIGASW